MIPGEGTGLRVDLKDGWKSVCRTHLYGVFGHRLLSDGGRLVGHTWDCEEGEGETKGAYSNRSPPLAHTARMAVCGNRQNTLAGRAHLKIDLR